MEIPGNVSLYCPLIDAKGTKATLVSVENEGFYHLEVVIQGQRHTMFVPIGHTAIYFADPEPDREPEFEIER